MLRARRTPFFILFIAERLAALPAVVHATEIGWLRGDWRVKAVSDIDVSRVNVVLEGPIGGYEDAARSPRTSRQGFAIAAIITQPPTTSIA